MTVGIEDRVIVLGDGLPPIPERLLLAHARGEVRFICGAGILKGNYMDYCPNGLAEDGPKPPFTAGRNDGMPRISPTASLAGRAQHVRPLDDCEHGVPEGQIAPYSEQSSMFLASSRTFA